MNVDVLEIEVDARAVGLIEARARGDSEAVGAPALVVEVGPVAPAAAAGATANCSGTVPNPWLATFAGVKAPVTCALAEVGSRAGLVARAAGAEAGEAGVAAAAPAQAARRPVPAAWPPAASRRWG